MGKESPCPPLKTKTCRLHASFQVRGKIKSIKRKKKKKEKKIENVEFL